MNNHIQISDVTPRIQYVADGSQTQFSYPFPIFVEDDLEIYANDNKEVSGYSVLGAGTSYGGSVVFDTPPASGVVVTLRRSLAIDRTTDFQQSGAFRAKDINDELDYLTAALQQVADDVGRAVRLSSTHEDADLELPSKDERANKVLGFDASGDVIATSGSGSSGSGSGVTDHGQLTGLSDDDHPQYHNDTRGDARYYTRTALDIGQLDGRYYTETEVDAAFAALGSAAALDVGATVGDVVQLEDVGGGTPGLPAVDASQLTGLPSGVSDHGALTGLSDDDHSQYHNDTRGDARYYTQGQVDSALSAKSDTSHNHDAAYAAIAHVSDTGNPHGVTAAQAGALPAGTKLDDLVAPDDNTDLNASTSKHGLLPKLSGSAGEYLDGSGAWSTPAGGVGGGLTVLAPHTTTAALNLSSDSVQTATAVPSATTLPAISATDRQVEFVNRSGSTINVARNGSDTIRVDGTTGQTTVAVPNNAAALFHVDAGQTEWQVQIVTDKGESNTLSSAGTGASLVAPTPKVGTSLQVRGLASPDSSIAFADDNPNSNKDLSVNQAALTVSRTNVPAVDASASRTMSISNDLGSAGRQEGFIRLSHASAQYDVVKNIAAVGQRFMVQWTNAAPSQATPFSATGGGVTFVPSAMPAIDTQYQTLCLLCVDATTDANVLQILPAAL